MKKTILLLMACFCLLVVHAAYLRDVPMTLTQPDGSVLHCFASGDEFFNYLHDENGYTIMQHPQTGFYVYADKRDGKLVATDFVAGSVDPASKNIQPFNLISPEEWMARRNAWHEKEKQNVNRDDLPNHGTLNNISIFIRFSDDAELTNSYSDIDNMFNNVSEGAVSMRSYFRAASYGAIEIPTTFYPGHNGDLIISYKDTYPRSYFEPYNSSTNPNGYQDDERAEREFSLLERAVKYINEYYPVPTNLNIDYDDDGCVDNVCFIVRGGVGAWNSLLWPHKWTLYGKDVYINGKRVWTFNFQLADATDYFNTSTMCHEMNHSLGAPDLYHYYYGTSLDPVGTWDLMEYNMMPPQHCGAYMKMKYSHWVDEIPEITEAGTYTLNPVSSATPTNIAYKIATDDPYQFYVLEYRDNTSLFETALPGSGLLVYRIDTRFDGNVNYNADNGVYDEVYIFRPGGSSSENGNFFSAHLSAGVGRTEFNASTDAYPFFSDGTIDNNFNICNITTAGNTISFTYDPGGSVSPEGIYLGDGGTEASKYLPSYNLYNYSLTQQIYTSDELGEEGIITGMAFYNGGAAKTRSYDFYMKNTTKITFSNATDWVPVTPMDLVFSGTVTMAADKWTVINFDVPFAYDGASNVVLVADDNTGEWTNSPHMTCLVYGAPSQAIYIYHDDINYVPYNPTQYSGTVMDMKNQLMLYKTTPEMQVFADYYPDIEDPASPYVKVRWGNGISNVEDFERGDFSLFDWQFQPAYPWVITAYDPYEGNYCSKSGNEGVHGSTSAMEITMVIPNEGQISFFSKISSEVNWDFGYFYIDGIERGSYSGNGRWGERTFAVNAGVHTFKWAYTKDVSVSQYDDCFYVDYIRFYSSDAFVYDFENSRLPAGWTTIDADGDGNDWSMGSDVLSLGCGHNGSNDMVLSKSYASGQGALYPDNFLVSEQVNITNGSHFTFWACAQNANWAAEHFGVFVSLGSNSNPDDFQEVQSWTMTAKGGGGVPLEGKASRDGSTRVQGNWYYYDVDLSAFAGAGYIAIRHYGCSDMYYLNIDDVAFVNSSKSGSKVYSVYRAKCDGSDLRMIADNVTQNYYIDTDWENLDPDMYKYGVCAKTNESKGTISWTATGNGSTQHQPLTREAAEAMGVDINPSASFNGSNRNLMGGRAMWDLLGSFNCNSGGQQAVATDGDYIYTASWQDSPSGSYAFYKYTMNGTFVEGFDIDGVSEIRDLTFDGQYFYCGNNSSTLYCLDLANQTLVGTISTACSAIRHCSYDPERDGFWLGDWSTLALYSRTGDLVQTACDPSDTYGSAYYRDDDNVEHLYLFTQFDSGAYVYDYNIADNTIGSDPIFSFTGNLPECTGMAGGAFIGKYGNKMAFFGNVQQVPNLVGIYELSVIPSSWSNCIEKMSAPHQTTFLSEGWNWFSTYMEVSLDDLKDALMTALPETSIIIKSRTQSIKYIVRTHTWNGTLDWDVTQMYKIDVPNACEITLEGNPIDPPHYPITIVNGPNWIGYPLAESMTVTAAFANFGVLNGDVIKAKSGSTRYMNGSWRPNGLTILVPGQGYIFNSAATGERTLVFPSGAK